MVNVLLFGGSGQLGKEIIQRAEDLHFSVQAPSQKEVSITDREDVIALARSVTPDVIVNCAAYTAVDKAEQERDLCFEVNSDGVGNVALACREAECRLIHFSTDYVFQGEKGTALTEQMPSNPINVYGESKLAGERSVIEILGERATILRVSSLHGQYGNNFVHTMIRLFEERELVQVVGDQIMSPTWAGWLADVVLDMCRKESGGVFHACCSGAISWYDFAKEIYEQAKQPPSGWKARLESVPAEQYPTAAKRPAYSVLSCDKLQNVLGRAPMSWQNGLEHHLRDIGRL